MLFRSNTAARFGFELSEVSGCAVFEKEATAVTAFVNSDAYGEEAATRCCAFTMREAEINSIAFVIFFVALTERIRRR